MSFAHLAVAVRLTLDYPAGKLVLIQLADPACETCGLAWPGISYLSRVTGMGPTTVRKALDWLAEKERELVRIHAYPRGGRGVATEYVVLPGFLKFSTAPCEECRAKMKTHRNPVGIGADAGAKPTGIRGVSAIPTTLPPQNPSESGDHPIRESHPTTAPRAEPTVENSPAARPTPSGAPPPRSPQEALAIVTELTKPE